MTATLLTAIILSLSDAVDEFWNKCHHHAPLDVCDATKIKSRTLSKVRTTISPFIYEVFMFSNSQKEPPQTTHDNLSHTSTTSTFAFTGIIY